MASSCPFLIFVCLIVSNITLRVSQKVVKACVSPSQGNSWHPVSLWMSNRQVHIYQWLQLNYDKTRHEPAGRLFCSVTKGGSTEQLLVFSASGDKFVRCWLSPNSPNSCFCKGPSNYSLCWCLFCRKSVRSFVGEAKACRVSKKKRKKNCWRLATALEFSVAENSPCSWGSWQDTGLFI